MAVADIDALLARGIEKHRAEALEEAEALYSEVLSIEPHLPEGLHLLGVVTHQRGRHAAAAALITQAIEIRPDAPDYYSNLAAAQMALGQMHAARKSCETAIRYDPRHPGALKNLVAVLRNLGDREALADEIIRQATVIGGDADRLVGFGSDLYHLGRKREASQCFAAASQADPQHAMAHYNLGIALSNLERYDEAIAALKTATALKPDHAEAHMTLGTIFQSLRRWGEAEAAYKTAIACDPNFATSYYNLGSLLKERGGLDEALSCYRKAVDLRSNFVEAILGIGNVRQAQGLYKEAADAYETAVSIQPGYLDAWSNLGAVYKLMNELRNAETALRRALAEDPRAASAHNNLGLVLRDQGRVDDALAHLRRAVSLDPGFQDAHGNLIFSLFYDTEVTGTDILESARAWNERHARPVPAQHVNAPDPDRRLRIGYVSGDFRDHAVAYYIEPLIHHRDPDSFEVYCYAEHPRDDAVTARIRGAADHWRVIYRRDDTEVERMIAEDQIDILIDCAGHTAGSRLPAFLGKPAPVQVGLVLAHGGTTGVAAIDAIIGDPWVTPPDFDRHFSEKVVRLPRVLSPFRPREDWPEPFPRPTDGPITLACFGDPSRIGRPTLVLWRRILDAIPQSRLLLKHKAFNDASLHDQWRMHFAILGDRYDLEDLPKGWATAMDVYGRVDIALDTFPVSGGTSSLIPLWMGVPLLTLAGDHSGQRFGASMVANAGFPEFVAASSGDYIKKVVALARDRQQLQKLRRSMRATMQQSPVCDALGVTREFEAALRGLWRDWCAAQAQRADLSELFEAARAQHEQGDIAEAEAAYRRILAVQPAHLDSLHMLGITAHQKENFAEAQRLIEDAIRGGLANAAAYSNLGEVLRAQGHLDKAVESYQRALGITPGHVIAMSNLGETLGLLGQADAGRSILEQAITLAPGDTTPRKALAAFLYRAGDTSRAEAVYRETLALNPELSSVWNGLGNCLERQRQLTEAEECYRHALELAPRDPDVHNNLGVVLLATTRPLDAIAAFQRAIELRPNYAAAFTNLGNAQRDMGEIGASLASYRRAIELDPSIAVAHSNLIFTLAYDETVSGREIFSAAAAFGNRFEMRASTARHTNAADPERKLRVAYLSPDFRRHAVAFYMEPILAAHDREAFEVLCYSDAATPDETTLRIKQSVDLWRDTLGVSDTAFAERLRLDRVDIVVDCAGHTKNNRLVALALRPAPVQMSTAIGNASTTGLSAIDYLICDPVLVPDGRNTDFTETLLRLPRVLAPFRPDPEWPDTTPLPDGDIVFACFADPARLGPATLAAWARIFERLPAARLLFKNHTYNEPALLDHWRQRFANITPRISFEGVSSWSEFMEVYSRIAICLDSFPVTGGTSTLIPLWMGVPVVTLAGTHAAQRFGASMLTSAACEEFIAADWGHYIEIATSLAEDTEQLAAIRRGLRQRVATAPICDARGVTRETEDAYRLAWRRWCAVQGKSG